MRFAQSKDDLSPEAVSCRGIGHRWLPSSAKWLDVAALKFHGYNVTLICDRCGAGKHFMLSERGEYFPATYSYPSNYLLAKGQPYLTKEDRGQFKLDALQEWLPAPETPHSNVSPIISTRRKRKA